MNSRITNIAQVEANDRNASLCERRLAELDGMLHGLGVTLWQTDRDLRLVDSHGMEIAECFHGRRIGDFYREAYGLGEAADEPIRAHLDARSGVSVTMHVNIRGGQYVMLVEPRRDGEGGIVGTMGMALRVA